MYNVIQMHSWQNRAERRALQNTRTSPSLNTKKWTLGRLVPHLEKMKWLQEKEKTPGSAEALSKFISKLQYRINGMKKSFYS